MFKLKMASLALALVGVSGLAAAATQGTVGATSTGSYTNTFNSIARQVQILNLADTTMTPSSGKVFSAVGVGNFPGGGDSFCVVDTAGGAVKLVLTATNPLVAGTTGEFTAKEPGGDVLIYTTTLVQPGVASTGVFNNLTTTGFTLPAGKTVTSTGACGVGGNVEKSIHVKGNGNLPVGSKVFTDTVTIVATPI